MLTVSDYEWMNMDLLLQNNIFLNEIFLYDYLIVLTVVAKIFIPAKQLEIKRICGSSTCSTMASSCFRNYITRRPKSCIGLSAQLISS